MRENSHFELTFFLKIEGVGEAASGNRFRAGKSENEEMRVERPRKKIFKARYHIFFGYPLDGGGGVSVYYDLLIVVSR